MPTPPAPYPPYQQPIVSRGGLVSTVWQRFFLTLVGSGDLVTRILPGTITLDQLPPIDSPRLLGRGSPGTGAVEQITIGAGLALTGTELHATADGISGLGYWTPITNGDPASPEILFDAEGDCVVGFVPTP
jgi:hypothetical protein